MARIKICILVVIFLSGFTLPLSASTDEFLTVQVKKAQLRSTPSFLGSVTGNLSYGDKIKLIEDKGAWKKVGSRKITGWVHISALSTKIIALQAGKTNAKTGATNSELSLAGKGFNAKVEAEFKNKNKNINYSQVDRMESLSIKPAQMHKFLKQGLVIIPEGNVP